MSLLKAIAVSKERRNPSTASNRLFWAVRPKHLSCTNPGCGRTPLMGFRDREGERFYCACCWTDGSGDRTNWRHPELPDRGRPRLRSPEERARILGGEP